MDEQEPLPAQPTVTEPVAAHSTAGKIDRRAVEAEQIPARMLNEFVYCPRLFYDEFVEGVVVESADTLRGEAIHQRVDTGTDALPKAKRKAATEKSKQEEKEAETESASKEPPAQAAEPETIHSRSVHMGSAR